MKHSALTSGMGVTRWFRSFVSDIPVSKPSGEETRSIARLVDDIIATKDTDPDAGTAAQEDEIDRLVYDLYGLDQQEIAAVRKATS